MDRSATGETGCKPGNDLPEVSLSKQVGIPKPGKLQTAQAWVGLVVEHVPRFVLNPTKEVAAVADLVRDAAMRGARKPAKEERNSILREGITDWHTYINSIVELAGLLTHKGIDVSADQVSLWGVDITEAGVWSMLQGSQRTGLLLYTLGGLCDVFDGQRARTAKGGYPVRLVNWVIKMSNGEQIPICFRTDNGPINDGNADRLAEGNSLRVIVHRVRDAYYGSISEDEYEMIEDLPHVIWFACLARALGESYGVVYQENGEDDLEFWGTSLGRRLMIPLLALKLSGPREQLPPWSEIRGYLKTLYHANIHVAHKRLEMIPPEKMGEVVKQDPYLRHRGYYDGMKEQLAAHGVEAAEFLQRYGLGVLIPVPVD